MAWGIIVALAMLAGILVLAIISLNSESYEESHKQAEEIKYDVARDAISGNGSDDRGVRWEAQTTVTQEKRAA